MITRKLILAGLMALATTSFAEAKDWKSVTIALEGAYAPWNMTNPDGTIGGFEPELTAYLCKHAGVECKLIAQDWDGMIAALNAGKFDVIMDALSITDERKQAIDFTVPYAATPAAFVALKSGPLAKLAGTGTTIKLGTDAAEQKKASEALRTALKGKTVGIQAATVYAKYVYDTFGDVASVREYKTAAERDLDVVSGRIDVGFDDVVYLNSAFEKADNAELALTGPEIAGPIWGEGEGLGIRKADTDLKAKFDAAIKAALADGTVKKLSLKWFKVDVSP